MLLFVFGLGWLNEVGTYQLYDFRGFAVSMGLVFRDLGPWGLPQRPRMNTFLRAVPGRVALAAGQRNQI